MKRSISVITAVFGIAIASLVQSKPPPGFVEQTLEPTGGKINKPRGWFFSENHAEDKGGIRLMWTLAKEDPRKGSYDTGFRIQYFLNVREATSKTPEQFIAEFMENKRKEAKQIPRDCAPRSEGSFTRVCLETEEGPYHILYSLFWNNAGDSAVVTVAGAKKNEWSKYSPIFNQMGHGFTLLDPKHLDEKASEEKHDKKN